MTQELLHCRANDLFVLPERSTRTYTRDGFMRAKAKIASTGVQVYRAADVGLDQHGIPGDRVLRLYRPPEAVFDPTSMQSFEGAPVTFKHPPKRQNVDATNWRHLAVGDQYGIGRDGDYLTANIFTIRDAAAVRAVDAGTTELSCGYDFDVDLTPGKTPDGQAYDGVMKNIVGNHTAIVDKARGGPGCRVGDEDNEPGARRMALTPRTYGGIPVELEAQVASIVDKALADQAAQITSLTQARDAATSARDAATSQVTSLTEAAAKAKTAHDAALTEANAKAVTQDRLDGLVEERILLIGDAVRAHDGLQPKGKSNDQIVREVLIHVTGRDEAMKEVVGAMLGDGMTVEKATTDKLAQAFRAMLAVNKRLAAADAASGGEGGGEGAGRGSDRAERDGIRRAFDAALVPESPGGGGGGGAGGARGRDGVGAEGQVREVATLSGRDEYVDRTTVAWKEPVGQPGVRDKDARA